MHKEGLLSVLSVGVVSPSAGAGGPRKALPVPLTFGSGLVSVVVGPKNPTQVTKVVSKGAEPCLFPPAGCESSSARVCTSFWLSAH